MGKAIFQTEIIELGEQVDAFFEEGMFVLFGDNVPEQSKKEINWLWIRKNISSLP